MNMRLVGVAVLLAAGAAVALNPDVLNGADPAAVQLQAAHFTRTTRHVTDGGADIEEVWYVRACGRVMLADGGWSAEPCWDQMVPVSVFQTVENLLENPDAGVFPNNTDGTAPAPPPQQAEAF